MNARTAPERFAPVDETSRLRVPPHSIAAEQHILGALLLDSTAIERIAGVVDAAAFYRHEHRAIFAAIAAQAAAGKRADLVTVFEALGDQAASAGGLPYLNDLAQSVTGTANIRRYAEIVRERAQLRQCIALADEIATAAFRGDAAQTVIDSGSAAILRMATAGQRLAPKAIGDLLVGAIDRYTAREKGTQEAGFRTGLGQLDRYLAPGLKPGKVYCVAARPSVGKSSIARTIAIRIATRGRTVLVLSQEMPQDEQADCVIAELGRIDSEHLQTGRFVDGDWGRMVEAVEEARGMPLLFDEQGALTLADIRAKARACKGLGLLIVDYLQLCSSTLTKASTNDQVAEISKGLKALALEMQIPVIVLSQLNREVEKRQDKQPTLADLRDSGAIEQDVDVALLLWTVSEDEKTSTRIVGVNVAKNRGGKRGRFAMRFDAPVYGWSDAEFPPPSVPASAPRPQVRKGTNL